MPGMNLSIHSSRLPGLLLSQMKKWEIEFWPGMPQELNNKQGKF
jgi:hypothetical protein